MGQFYYASYERLYSSNYLSLLIILLRQYIIVQMLEYLILNNQIEAAEKLNNSSNKSFKDSLLNYFTKGKREEFFRIYKYLKKEQKLQFYVRVYFLIYSIHPHIKPNKGIIPQEEVKQFKHFLDNKGAQLAKSNQFLQFYALPFIKNPLQHAKFKALFRKQWVQNLKQKIILYSNQEQKRLKQLVRKQLNITAHNNVTAGDIQVQNSNTAQKYQKYQEKIRSMQKINDQLFQKVSLFTEKYHQLQQNHQNLIQNFNNHMLDSQNKWFQSTKELVTNAKSLIQIILTSNIQIVNERKFIKIKKKIQKYEKFVAKQLDQLISVSQDISIFDKPSVNQISGYTAKSIAYTQKNNLTTFVGIDEYIPTDYEKLKRQFPNMDVQNQKLIILGFCWRIIKSKNSQIRKQNIIGLIQSNFLGLNDKQVMKFIINSQLRYHTLYLLRCLKDFYYARKKIFQQSQIHYELMDELQNCILKKDFTAFQFIVQFLSILSSYKNYAQNFLQNQLWNFYLEVLQAYPVLFENENVMESITLTLINLSVSQKGLKQFQKNQNVFSILSEAYQYDFQGVNTWVSAIYYQLLGNKKLYDAAHAANLPQFIKYYLNSDLPPQTKHQFSLIDERLSQFKPNQKYRNQFEDGEDQQQSTDDINQQELQNLQDLIKGNEYLTGKYLLKNKEAKQQQQQVKSLLKQFKKNSNKVSQKQISVQQKKDMKQKKKEIPPQNQMKIQNKQNSYRRQAYTRQPQKNSEYQNQLKNQGHNIKKEQSKLNPIDQKRSARYQHEKQRPISQQNNYEPKKQVFKNPHIYEDNFRSPQFKIPSSVKNTQQKKQKYISGAHHLPNISKNPSKQKLQPIGNSFQSVKVDNFLEGKDRYKSPSNRYQRIQTKQQTNSQQRSEYRIKKSLSVQKNIAKVAQVIPNTKNQREYRSNKVSQPRLSTVEDGHIIKSPPVKQRRQEILQQINNEIKQKKAFQDRKLSVKNLNQPLHRQNKLVDQKKVSDKQKKQQKILSKQDQFAFAARPKIRRTPPKQE